MLLLIAEIAMLVGGAYALFTGKLPQFLVGGKGEYKLEGGTARLIGLALMTPIPIAFVVTLGLALVSTFEEGSLVPTLIEAGIVIVIGLGVGFWIRSARTPAMASTSASDMASPGPGAPGAGR
jgi:hypothetical protein